MKIAVLGAGAMGSLYGAKLSHHRKTEIDRINGAIAELADEYGIVAPCNKMLIRLVHVMEG